MQFDALDVDATIYAAEPWTSDSKAMLAYEPAGGGVPNEARNAGLIYFLEVSIAQEFAEGLVTNRDMVQSLALCRRLIHYAIHDA